ncbi:hypothetical protein ACTXGU_00090 [Niallia sp. 01092]|uniref:hypothetical protein n=1 Tax=Niallia sp. 01092 TaxID=3457759 RepID=UPI003FD02D44
MAVSIKEIKEEVSVYDEMVSFEVELNNEEREIKFYPYFKPTKINKMIEELSRFFANAEKEKIHIPEEKHPEIVMYFIIRHFTDLKFGAAKKAKTIFQEFNIVINSSVFKILSESFPKSSVEEVFERINEVVANTDKLISMQSVVNTMSNEFAAKYKK